MTPWQVQRLWITLWHRGQSSLPKIRPLVGFLSPEPPSYHRSAADYHLPCASRSRLTHMVSSCDVSSYGIQLRYVYCVSHSRDCKRRSRTLLKQSTRALTRQWVLGVPSVLGAVASAIAMLLPHRLCHMITPASTGSSTL